MKEKQDLIREWFVENPGTLLTALEIAKKFNFLPNESSYIRSQRVRDLKKRALKNKNQPQPLLIEESSIKVNLEKDTLESTKIISFEPKSIESLYKEHNIDPSVYKIKNYWSKKLSSGKFTSSVFATLRKSSKEFESDLFTEFLKTYKSSYKPIKKEVSGIPRKGCLVFPKQDAHFDKLDVYGKNDIDKRFQEIFSATYGIINRVSVVNYLEEIVYIVGSDQFNSEWTNLTTKGTPQQNILSTEESFQRICDFEVECINLFLAKSNKVNILYIPGNHDQYTAWYLIQWLKAYYKDEPRVILDNKPVNRKYLKYGKSALMFNHGDVSKQKELAHIFPMEFKDGWSECETYYIFTGDRHYEKSLDIYGIKAYQVAPLSKAVSSWDDKQGYTTSKAEVTAFLIHETKGMTDVYKEIV